MAIVRILNSFALLTAVFFSQVHGLSADDGRSGEQTSHRSTASIEEQLQQPSRVQFVSSHMTLRELIDTISQAHGLQIRIDKPVVALFAVSHESMLVTKDYVPRSHDSAHFASPMILAPGSVSLPVTAQPSPVAVQPPATSQPAPVYAGSYVTVPAAVPSPTSSPATSSLATSSLATSPYRSEETQGQPSASAVTPPRPTIPDGPGPNDLTPAVSPTPQPVEVRKPIQQVSADQEEPLLAEEPAQDEEEATAVAPVEASTVPAAAKTLQLNSRVMELFLNAEISTAGLPGPDAPLEFVLEDCLSRLTTVMDMSLIESDAAMPMMPTFAYELAVVPKSNHLLITTVLAANLDKSTRVYRVSHLDGLEAEAIRDVITKTIRPWSWRSQVDTLIGKVSADFPDSISVPTLNLDLSGIVESGVEVASAVEEAEPAATQETQVDLAMLKGMGQLLSTGTMAAAHSVISGVEMMHYADPPTADIEVLPGMLVVTHSYPAHREIQDLLQQLEEALSHPE